MRATAQDKNHGTSGRYKTLTRLSRFTFIIGFSHGGLSAVFLISSHVGQINFYIGFLAGIKAFVAAVLGGIGVHSRCGTGQFSSLVLPKASVQATSRLTTKTFFAFIILVLILIFPAFGSVGDGHRRKKI